MPDCHLITLQAQAASDVYEYSTERKHIIESVERETLAKDWLYVHFDSLRGIADNNLSTQHSD
jgi:hypothetical protein